ncbi:MAG: hypothetical protein K8L99_02785 [Anaerolineae bacterium]|nr:hypothetical protein [Anaerolineae bacterium]
MRKVTIIALALLMLALPAAAQDSWFTYLYNWESASLVHVDSGGNQTSYPLGLSENATFNTRDMAFTADGSRVAFCAINYSSETPSSTLYLRDIAGQTNLLQIDLGTRIGCSVKPDAFNDAETQLAVGLINHFGVGDPNAQEGVPAWQLQVLDVASGNVVNELNADSPAAASSGMIPDGVIMPEVRSFSGDTIIFAEVPYAVGGPTLVSAFAWQLSSNSLAPVPEGPYSYFAVDSLAGTGEMAWAANNPNLPTVETDSPFGMLNVVVVGSPSGEQRIVYHTADATIIDVRFINNGQQLAILLFPPFSPDQTTVDTSTRWIALDRAGNITELQTNTEFGGGLEAAPGGYIYLKMTPNENDFEASQFALSWYNNGQAQELWSAQGQAWEIVWSAPTPSAPDFPAFTPVA